MRIIGDTADLDEVRLILSEVGAFKLGNASLKGSIGIRLCGDCIRTSPVHRFYASHSSTAKFGEEGLFGVCLARGCTFSMENSGKVYLFGVYKT